MSKVIQMKDHEDKRIKLAVARMTPEELYKRGYQLAIAAIMDEKQLERTVRELNHSYFGESK